MTTTEQATYTNFHVTYSYTLSDGSYSGAYTEFIRAASVQEAHRIIEAHVPTAVIHQLVAR